MRLDGRGLVFQFCDSQGDVVLKSGGGEYEFGGGVINLFGFFDLSCFGVEPFDVIFCVGQVEVENHFAEAGCVDGIGVGRVGETIGGSVQGVDTFEDFVCGSHPDQVEGVDEFGEDF